jgi:hypothetical protein
MEKIIIILLLSTIPFLVYLLIWLVFKINNLKLENSELVGQIILRDAEIYHLKKLF